MMPINFSPAVELAALPRCAACESDARAPSRPATLAVSMDGGLTYAVSGAGICGVVGHLSTQNPMLAAASAASTKVVKRAGQAEYVDDIVRLSGIVRERSGRRALATVPTCLLIALRGVGSVRCSQSFGSR